MEGNLRGDQGMPMGGSDTFGDHFREGICEYISPVCPSVENLFWSLPKKIPERYQPEGSNHFQQIQLSTLAESPSKNITLPVNPFIQIL
jgi:hypothetical protein